MPAERYFVATPFTPEQTILLKEQEFHHLAHVMRSQVGDTVELVNGQGQLAQGVVQEIKKNGATLQIQTCQEMPSSPKRKLLLAQALPRLPKLEWIVEKGTELGVDAFWLFPGLYSEKKDLSPSQKERLSHIAIAALKQCGRLTLPSIDLLPPLASWSMPIPQTLLLYGDLDAPLSQVIPLAPHHQQLMVLIGPEKGWHPQEKELLKRSSLGIRLHENTLRTETAALTALVKLQEYLH